VSIGLTVTVLTYTNSSFQFFFWVGYCSVSYWRSAFSSKDTWLFHYVYCELSPHYIYSFHTVLKYLFLVLLLLLFAFVFIMFHKNAEHTYINLAAFVKNCFKVFWRTYIPRWVLYFTLEPVLFLTGYLAVLC